MMVIDFRRYWRFRMIVGLCYAAREHFEIVRQGHIAGIDESTGGGLIELGHPEYPFGAQALTLRLMAAFHFFKCSSFFDWS